MKYLEDSFIKSVERSALWWQEKGLTYTASGYGRKIPTEYVMTCSDNRKRRVYCCVFSHSGLLYIKVKGQTCIIQSEQIENNLLA